MRKKGGTFVVELSIIGAVLLVSLAILGIWKSSATIANLISPVAPTVVATVNVALLPTPAPTVTPQPAATAILEQTSPPAELSGQALMTSHLRREPRVADETEQAILCPNDAIVFLAQQAVDDVVWYRVRVVAAAACVPNHVSVGDEGWASGNVLSHPPASVPLSEE